MNIQKLMKKKKTEPVAKFICALIISSIVTHALYTKASEPFVYVAEVAHAEEVEAPKKDIGIIVKIDWTPSRIAREVEAVAEKYGVDADLMHDIIECESMGSTTIQSFHTKHGVREESYGLVQIHLPSHKNVTKKEALDPQFAIDFLGKHLADGRAKMWSCFDIVR